ncbi:TPA: hypothetical protein ACF5XO_002805 [Legionella pneumophila]|nr:hypothetical protein [Legionella pneumophila]HBD7081441.1 hypothetical protein [Legionella pneumophila]HCC0693747.1 hypothetical protein [Legionella pneumophila]
MQPSICKLCESKFKLHESHIIPRFIYKWLKKTSKTGHLRIMNKINHRIQDGYKKLWLCQNCETLFGKWEKYFAEQIFIPVIKNNSAQFLYNENLIKFAVSIFWRVLLFFKEENLLKPSISSLTNSTLNKWSNFIQNNIANPGCNEVHLYNLVGYPNDSTNISIYLSRTIDFDVIFFGNDIFVYIKLPFFIITGYLNLESKSELRESRIKLSYGNYPKKINFPGDLWRYINNKALYTEQCLNNLSDEQQSKILQSLRKISLSISN